MKYSIVFSSVSGNTEIIAKAIKDVLDKSSCSYFGKPDEISAQDAETIFVGFWVLKGSCPEETKTYLKTLENKKIFLFGTAGFGGSETYFETILTDVKQYISKTNTIIGSFMCQGKMQASVLSRYEKLLIEQPENSNVSNMICNYKNALSHPDIQDIETAKEIVKKVYSTKQ